MSASTATTGRNGRFYAGSPVASPTVLNTTPVARCTQWAVNQRPAPVTEWGDSDGGGYTNRAPGRRDCTFTAEGKFDTGTTQKWEIFQAGDYCGAILFVNYSTDATWAYTFPRALCTEFNLTINIDTEEVVGWTSNWGSDGSFTLPGGVAG